MSVVHLVPGPGSHGVVRHALTLLAQPPLTGSPVVRGRHLGSPPGLHPRLAHLHVTDHLWGESPDAAAAAVERVAQRCPVSLTLHDLPQEGEGAGRRARRAAGYRRMVAAARGVVVASEHERELLLACLDGGPVPPVEVVPLPLDAPDLSPARPPSSGEVAVLGYLYPGKGHLDVLDAMAGLPSSTGFAALGAHSPGHDDLVGTVVATARAQGRVARVTGWLADAAMHDEARRVAVPVVAPVHVSASGSVGSWITAGRRPLATTNPYVAELARRCPGAVTLVERDDLPAAIARALADPSSTWLEPSVTIGPSTAEAAQTYADVLAGWAR